MVGWGKKGYTLGEGCTKVLASTLHHLRHHVTHTITSLNTYNHTHWYLHSKDDLLRLYKRLLCCLYQDHSFPPSNTPYNSYTRALLHLSESHLVSISVPCSTESVSRQTVRFPANRDGASTGEGLCGNGGTNAISSKMGQWWVEKGGSRDGLCNATAGVIVRRAFESEFFVE